MFDLLPGPLGTFANFLVIALGFGSIIFIHELGHFVAAKWAGIRVLAFSIGFGHVLVSYRKGIGFRRGSSDAEYRKLVYGSGDDAKPDAHTEISPTEYRLSMLPLGGYVKMLGQEDLNPDATSEAPDSYQNCPVGKRMVVISAGVVMNMVMAAILFIIVFMAGLQSLPAEVGFVTPNSPAAKAIAIDHPELAPGLQRGDRILSINNKAVYSFEDILPEIAMASKDAHAKILVERPGIEDPIAFETIPTKSELNGLLEIGISPALSTTLKSVSTPAERRLWAMSSREFGMDGLEPADRFISVNSRPITSPFDVLDAAKAAPGQPLTIEIQRGNEHFEHTIEQVQALQVDLVEVGEQVQAVRHILGLTGVMMVNPYADPQDTKQGLEPGDIFVRIGNVEYPSIGEGITAIRAHKGQPLDLVVLRDNQRVKLTVEVTPSGTIGFYQAMSTTHTNLVSKPARFVRPIEADENDDGDDGDDGDDAEQTRLVAPPAYSLIEYPGSRIIAVGDSPITTLRDVPNAILRTIDQADESNASKSTETFTIPITLELPLPVQPDGSTPTTVAELTIDQAQLQMIRELGTTLPGDVAMVNMFQYAQVIVKADGPIDAISRGMSKSRRVMIQTYITFLRLFEGSVKVEHLKGPVGIAHIGTQLASQGWVWVLFFMALISVNLAVINFLPLPIVDGGQFLMLVYEWIRGKPVPIVVQNIATMAGLLMIGTIFLYVTFNDVKALFGL